jgi:mono/diheme cytochrome c family protein
MMTRAIWLSAATAVLLYALCFDSRAGEADVGKQMYLKYCASCHGVDAKGNGPVVKQLKLELTDLTQLRKKNRGIFPFDDVMATIDGRRTVKGHGDRDMPVWGEVFPAQRDKKKYRELTTLLKAKIIAEYVATLQQ